MEASQTPPEPPTPEQMAAVEAEHREDPQPASAAEQAPPTASAPKEPPTAPAAVVDEYDPLTGHEVMLTSGEHAGQRAAVLKVFSRAGKAIEALVRFKSTVYKQTHAQVPYSALKPAEHPGHQ